MYGNYGQNPYANGGYPAMQNRLATLEQQYQQQYMRPQMPLGISGRLVTGIEEAKASQVALDGTMSYFPSPAEGKIYAKGIDMQGLPMFMVYELKTPENNNLNPQNEKNMQIMELKNRIEALENKIKEMTNNEPNANYGYAEQ